ncbi:MAG: hypothetical protein HS104_24350 [Polyangiaceae bacterium]|nr:hypothetical protein [Polyangiaceae bacterium]MCL4754285.1 hypothetical protein [Myxococcales bacterium]
MRYAILEPFGDAVHARDIPDSDAKFACPCSGCHAQVFHVSAATPHFRHEVNAPHDCIYRSTGGGGGAAVQRDAGWDLNVALSFADELRLPAAASSPEVEVAVARVLAVSAGRWSLGQGEAADVASNMLSLLRTADYTPFLRRCILGVARDHRHLLEHSLRLADAIQVWCKEQNWARLWNDFWTREGHGYVRFVHLGRHPIRPEQVESLLLQVNPVFCFTNSTARVANFEHTAPFKFVIRQPYKTARPARLHRVRLTEERIEIQSTDVALAGGLELAVARNEALVITPAQSVGMRRALLYAIPACESVLRSLSNRPPDTKPAKPAGAWVVETSDAEGDFVRGEHRGEINHHKFVVKYAPGQRQKGRTR